MTPRLLCLASVLLCATFLLYIYHPQFHTTAFAGGTDDNVMRGTVTVVDTININDDKTDETPLVDGGYISNRHVNREQSRRTYAYSGIRSAPDSDTSWAGPANVNLNINASYYKLDVEKRVLPAYVKDNRISTHEVGFEATTSGATVAQGEVKFYRNLKEDDPRKADCRIEVDAQEDWRDRPELAVWMVGHHWDKWDKSHQENDQRTREILAPIFVGIDFDCNPNATSYSGQQQIKMNPDGTSTRDVTWNIHSGPQPETEVEIIQPKFYNMWVPEAKEDEKTIGNFIDVEIVAHKQGDPGAEPPKKVLRYKIELEETSREKGVDLNWPPKSQARDDFDMKIDKNNPSINVPDDKGQSAETKESDLTDFTVRVNSYDWGGYTKLHVTAELEDHSRVVGHVRGHPEQEVLVLPKDDNSNHIADFWEDTHWGGTSAASGDDDETPYGDGDSGDGLSLYEEYRGFHAQGAHIRTEPKLKDIFIYDPSNLLYDSNNLGLGFFAASGLTIHLVKDKEFADEGGATNPHVINPNRGFATLGAQHLLRLKNENMPGLYGLADGNGPGPPKTTHTVKVDVARCLRTSRQELSCTIAHELSHACNVWHHGDIDYNISNWRKLQPDGTWGAWVQYADGSLRGVAAQGGQESGAEECIMRYEGNNLYETAAGPIQWKKADGSLQRGAEYPPMEAPGTIFCDEGEGTGVNASGRPGGPKAGNASKGKCQRQFCVNDTKH